MMGHKINFKEENISLIKKFKFTHIMKQDLLGMWIRFITKTLPQYFNIVLNSNDSRTYWQEYGLNFIIFVNELSHLGLTVVQFCES
jgi:hypothetical protein